MKTDEMILEEMRLNEKYSSLEYALRLILTIIFKRDEQGSYMEKEEKDEN